MTPEQLAARWLADVKRYEHILGDVDPRSDGSLIEYADSLAAIARHLAPGDDLVEQAIAALEGVTAGPWSVDGEPWNQIVWSGAENRVCFMAHTNGLDDDRDIATARFIAFARQWVPKAAARLSALTSERDEARKEAGIQMRHLKVLEGSLFTAEAEVSRLRDRLARMEGAIRALGVREMVAGWNGEGKDKPYTPHPAALGATIKTTCGVVYALDAALETPADGGSNG